LNPSTFRGYRYIVTFVDTVTRYAEIALLKNKDDIFNEFRKFITLEENQTGFKLKRLHSDNDLEYRNELFDSFLTEKGVIATYATPYAHEQNGLAEKFNRTLLNKIRALLI
jgi:transposase InsO family protein